MQLFSILSEFFTSIDEWVLCVCFAGLPLLWFLVCCPLHSEKIFRTFSTLLVCLSFVVFGCTYGWENGLYCAILLGGESFLFDMLIPMPKVKKEVKKEPTKVICYEEPTLPEVASHSLEEANVCLDHAFEIAAKLKTMALSGSDRLETDNVELTLRMYRAKGMLTDREMRSLNDCLAILLKLTAKYEC